MTETVSSHDIETTLSNREIFNSLVYTPWQDALKELGKRANNSKIENYLANLLPNGIPEAMRGKKSMVLFRHIATTNYEIRRFMMAADSLEELHPLILEYTQDKFNDRNEGKYFLGKLCFHKGMNKKGEAIWESVRIIDFNASNNKPIASLHTMWGEKLVDFHHSLFRESFPKHADSAEDISDWLRAFGSTARDYYKQFLSLFLKDGILFENFFIDEKEFGFTKDIILPALLELTHESGVKPLIVALAPTEIEGDQFWHAHPHREKEVLNAKLTVLEGI